MEPTWHRAAPAPLVLVHGKEELLRARAVERIVVQKRAHGEVQVTRLDAAGYSRGSLVSATSPSLFGEPGIVVLENAGAMNDDFLADALAYVTAPDPDCVVVVVHDGGQRGKKLLDTLKQAGAPRYDCPKIDNERARLDFATGEFERAGRPARGRAVKALVDAVGDDVAEIAAACAQLVSDVEGSIDEQAVARYYGTRVNATGFAVADAAIAGKEAEAIALVRHALATGTDPVPLVAALAMKVRQLIKVGASRGRGVDLKMAPWQVEQARKALARWDAERLAQAVQALARADAEIKGASRAPGFALERAVRTVASLASG